MASLGENSVGWSVDEENRALVGIRIVLSLQSLLVIDRRPLMCLVRLQTPL
jgi:hypothetical protein